LLLGTMCLEGGVSTQSKEGSEIQNGGGAQGRKKCKEGNK